MVKKFFSLILIICLILVPIKVSAYEITGFDITAKAGMLASMDTGEILYQKNADQKVYPASITKIMTVILYLEDEQYDPNSKVTMTEEVLKMILGTGSAVSNLVAGETFSQLDLAYMTLMSSFGDCAYLGAIFYEGSVEAFVDKMNAKAMELGLTGTHYANPIGLHDDENYTTVNDVRTLTLYALQNETFKKICETSRYTMPATNKH
ncbi:MAG: D-alanyl-D-alanine carboxypeptidase, partial [Clostridia bacterium]|nr:D-alanyl-D-alanine carboxypeptidase [Clostridia bacterium]